MMMEGFKAYDAEVKAGTYPAEEHTYAIDPEVLEAAKIN
jgi:3-methyl-2-oxobutanoate hydroxymethyltransferase